MNYIIGIVVLIIAVYLSFWFSEEYHQFKLYYPSMHLYSTLGFVIHWYRIQQRKVLVRSFTVITSAEYLNAINMIVGLMYFEI
jgi:hypothetical protein